MRELKNIKSGELNKAIIEMLDKLDIAGSTATYNLYRAIQDEQKKDKDYKFTLEPKMEKRCWIVKCFFHYPGYELLYHDSEDDCYDEIKRWTNCNLDKSTLKVCTEKLATKYYQDFKKDHPVMVKKWNKALGVNLP